MLRKEREKADVFQPVREKERERRRKKRAIKKDTLSGSKGSLGYSESWVCLQHVVSEKQSWHKSLL